MDKEDFGTPRFRRNAFWLSAVIVGLCAVVAASKLKEEVPTDRIASVQRLVEQFEAVALFGEYGADRKLSHVEKWTKPIRVSFEEGTLPQHREMVRNQSDQLSRLTDIKIEILISPEKSAGVVFRFPKRTEMRAVLAEYERDKKMLDRLMVEGICVAITWSDPDSGELLEGVSVIPHDIELDYLKECVLEEFTQLYGVHNDSELIHPSVFANEDTQNHQLTLNDKIIVRTLYDERISPGMKRAEALAMARIVITELVAKVKAEGESALYQR
ncbi:MAG: DUF2927 domain-containing protein [Rhodospirillales bacterium]|nr:DUF2927 domain-containing protein [Rhodospirillales bacterium]